MPLRRAKTIRLMKKHDVNEARGKKIVVFNDPTISFGGKITGGIRLKKVAGTPRQAAEQAVVEIKSDMQDFEDPPF